MQPSVISYSPLIAPKGQVETGLIEQWLREQDPAKLETLYQEADRVRRETVGEAIYLRGLIELSNRCVRSCGYCGLRVQNAGVARYRMEEEEVITCAHEAKALGYGTVVMQAGEDPELTKEFVAKLIRRIKAEVGLIVTLSLGERTREELEAWKEAGANRYLIRFETSNRELFTKIHPTPAGMGRDRFAVLRDLRELGFEVGSGVMIGIPGQSYGDLAKDIELFRTLDLDMIGTGPWLSHPDTPLASFPRLAESEQVPNSEEMTYKVVALARLSCPFANIPATTALATINKTNGRELGLQRGANIMMPNVTPIKYRSLYEIYPDKACMDETARQCHGCMARRIASIGRNTGTGPGPSLNMTRRGLEDGHASE